jgi:outer membrane protein, heavy metal efflux system
MKPPALLLSFGLVLLLGGCASLPPLEPRSVAPASELPWQSGEPLSADQAVRVALRHNPALAAAYADVQLSAADVFEATRWPNPSLELGWLFPLGQASGRQGSLGLGVGLTDLLWRGTRQRMARADEAAARARLADALAHTADQTRQAWVRAVAARQRLGVHTALAEVASLSGELAQRYRAAGNLDELSLQSHLAEASAAAIELEQARLEAAETLQSLQWQLGVPLPSDLVLEGPLPDVPEDALPDAGSLVAQALAQRQDLQALRRQLEARREALQATRRFRLLPDLHVGAERESDAGERSAGPRVEGSLPLFQQGQGRVRRAEADVLRAEAQDAEGQLAVRTEVNLQLARLKAFRGQALRYRDQLLPQRQAVVARLQERVDYMLSDSFELLQARRLERQAYDGYLEAVRDYWLAEAALQRAVGVAGAGS